MNSAAFFQQLGAYRQERRQAMFLQGMTESGSRPAARSIDAILVSGMHVAVVEYAAGDRTVWPPRCSCGACNHLALAGDGGLRTSGRWHTRGRRIVCCPENPAAAVLEVLVHFDIEIREMSARYRVSRISVADDVHRSATPRVATRGRRSDKCPGIGSAWRGSRPRSADGGGKP